MAKYERSKAGLCVVYVRSCTLTGPVADIAETAQMTLLGHEGVAFAATHVLICYTYSVILAVG
jgi:hypothetical protein